MSALLRQKIDPDDIVQEVAISCINAFHDVDLSRGDPFDWVSEMIRRRVVDAGRHFTGAEKRDAQREVPLAGRYRETVGWTDGAAGGQHDDAQRGLLTSRTRIENGSRDRSTGRRCSNGSANAISAIAADQGDRRETRQVRRSNSGLVDSIAPAAPDYTGAIDRALAPGPYETGRTGPGPCESGRMPHQATQRSHGRGAKRRYGEGIR